MVDLKQDMINARKGSDPVEKAFMVTFYAEVQMNAKNDGNRSDITEDDILKVGKKFLANLNESLTLHKSIGKDTAKIEQEIQIVSRYLPKQLSDEELNTVIAKYISDGERNIGKIMGMLAKEYTDLYNGKRAAEIIKNLLK